MRVGNFSYLNQTKLSLHTLQCTTVGRVGNRYTYGRVGKLKTRVGKQNFFFGAKFYQKNVCPPCPNPTRTDNRICVSAACTDNSFFAVSSSLHGLLVFSLLGNFVAKLE